MLSYRRETALSAALVWPKVEDWSWETIFYEHYRSIFNRCDIIGMQSYRIRWKTQKGLLRRSKSFKVIEVGNRKPVCDFLLVINSNWHPISYRFGVIAAYCPNFGDFEILDQCDPIGEKSLIFSGYSLVDPQSWQLAKKVQLTL